MLPEAFCFFFRQQKKNPFLFFLKIRICCCKMTGTEWRTFALWKRLDVQEFRWRKRNRRKQRLASIQQSHNGLFDVYSGFRFRRTDECAFLILARVGLLDWMFGWSLAQSRWIVRSTASANSSTGSSLAEIADGCRWIGYQLVEPITSN